MEPDVKAALLELRGAMDTASQRQSQVELSPQGAKRIRSILERRAEDLKPCPFCGGTSVAVNKEPRFGPETPAEQPEGWAFFVRCYACSAQGGWSKGPGYDDPHMGLDGARRLWNQRRG